MAGNVRGIKVRGILVMVITILLNVTLLGFSYYLVQYIDKISSCFVATNLIYGCIGIISTSVGLHGVVSGNIKLLRFQYQQSFCCSFFSVALSVLHFVFAFHMDGYVNNMQTVKTSFYTTCGCYAVLFICNISTIYLSLLLIKSSNIDACRMDAMEKGITRKQSNASTALNIGVNPV